MDAGTRSKRAMSVAGLSQDRKQGIKYAMATKIRIESLTFFRFIAALIIVVFHYGRKSDLAIWGKLLINSSHEMVTFFFVLSGFVMLVAHYRKDHEPLRDYYVARVARIVPVYFLALGLIVLLSKPQPLAFVLSATFTQAWVPLYVAKLNTPGWSLSVEMFFYLTFPLILFFIRKHEIKTSRFWILAVLLFLVTQVILTSLMESELYQTNSAFYHDIVYYLPLSHCCSFLLGAAGGLLFMRSNHLFGRQGWAPNLIFLGAFFAVYFFLDNSDVLQNAIGYRLAYNSSFSAPLFVILILGIACTRNVVTAMLSTTIPVFLGEISYALYILQKPVHTIYKRYISDHLGLDVNMDFYAYLALLVAVSAIVYLYFEKPCKSGIFKLNRLIAKKWPATLPDSVETRDGS
jgi:peptidoglycan/LPS O-acetylase OafA/YrhL